MTPLPWLEWTQKAWTLILGSEPPLPAYHSLDILMLKVWMYKIMFWEKSDQYNFFQILVGMFVGDPIGFTVLKHVYHFKTEILFKDLQNNFYKKAVSDEELRPSPH